MLFSEQRLLRRKKQKRELEQLRGCEDTAQALVIELETLRNMERPGQLNEENWKALTTLGAKITAPGTGPFTVEDLVANYHVNRILVLRQELREELAGGRT